MVGSAYLRAIAAEELIETILSDLPAVITPESVRASIAKNCAGHPSPFPGYMKHEERDATLIRLWDGTNTIQLATRFRISRSQVYRIVKRAKIVASFKGLRDASPGNLRP